MHDVKKIIQSTCKFNYQNLNNIETLKMFKIYQLIRFFDTFEYKNNNKITCTKDEHKLHHHQILPILISA